MRKDIKFKYVFLNKNTGSIAQRILTIVDISNGMIEKSLREMEGFSIIDSMQFTGLIDKNGKEIYEGDIMGWESETEKHDRSTWVVEFSANKGYKTWYSTMNDEVVIGNIYENPELLK